MRFENFLDGSFIPIIIGGTIRYIYGSIWRTIFNKPKFTYKEYINGPKRKNYYDEMGHEFNNRIIAFIVIGIVVCLLVNYYP